MITCDADADGQSIACLLLTMFYRLMPTMIHEGKVYIVHTPLYEVKLKDDSMVYLFSETEKDERLHTLDYKSIARCKGLGELEAETMAHCGMNPATRIITQVTVADVLAMQEAFSVWMDSEVAPRREIIETELMNYIENVD